MDDNLHPAKFTHGLLADQSSSTLYNVGLYTAIAGGLASIAGFGILLYEGFDRGFSRIVPGSMSRDTEITFTLLVIAIVVFLIGSSLLLFWKRSLKTRRFRMNAIVSDGTRLFHGEAMLRWESEATARLESGHYRVESLEGIDLQEVPQPWPEDLALVISVSVAKRVQVHGFSLIKGEDLIYDGTGHSTIAVVGKDAWATMDTGLGRDISAIEGLKRVRDVQKMIPAPLRVIVRVNPADTSASLVEVASLGVILSTARELIETAMARRYARNLVRKGLVVDARTGESLTGVCQEFGWHISM